jgi:SNF2 family DNA or RNA helicase
MSTSTPAKGCPICSEIQDIPMDDTLRDAIFLPSGRIQSDCHSRQLSSKLDAVLNSLAELDRTPPKNSEFPEKRSVFSIFALSHLAGLRKRSLVFSYWKGTLDIVESVLNGRGMSYTRIDGDSSVEQRIKAVERFQTDLTIKIMLLTLGTGSVGSVKRCSENDLVQ